MESQDPNLPPKTPPEPPSSSDSVVEVVDQATEEDIEAATVERTETQRIGEDGQPLEPPPGHGGRPPLE